jgi:hypothetical protein
MKQGYLFGLQPRSFSAETGRRPERMGRMIFFGVEGVQTGVFSSNINKMSFFIRLSISEGPN